MYFSKNIKDNFGEIKEFINAIEERYCKMEESIAGSSNKIMKVESCGLIANNNIELVHSYKNDYNFRERYMYRDPSIDDVCDFATKKTNELIDKIEKTHESNKAAIENNKQIEKAVYKMMETIGIPSSWSEWKFKTTRSAKRTEIKHTSGWVEDLRRCVKTSDGYDDAIKRCKTHLEEIESYRKSEKAKIEKEKKEKEKELMKQKEVTEAISYLTSIGLSAPDDFTIENAVELAKEKRLPEEEYMSKHAKDIIYDDMEGYNVLDTKITGEWRWGVHKESVILSEKTGKKYSVAYTVQSGDWSGFDELNFNLEFEEVIDDEIDNKIDQ